MTPKLEELKSLLDEDTPIGRAAMVIIGEVEERIARLEARIRELRGNLEIARDQGRRYKSPDDKFYGVLADKALQADDYAADTEQSHARE